MLWKCIACEEKVDGAEHCIVCMDSMDYINHRTLAKISEHISLRWKADQNDSDYLKKLALDHLQKAGPQFVIAKIINE